MKNEEQVIGDYLLSLDCHSYHQVTQVPLSIDGKKHLLHVLEDKTSSTFHDKSLQYDFMLQYRYGINSIVQQSAIKLNCLHKISLTKNIPYVESYELSMLCKRY